MKLFFTPEALRDFEQIGDWIAKDNPPRATSFVEELRLSCVEILNFPEKYQFWPRHEGAGLRRKVHGNYAIFYRVRHGQLEIIHILHGARNLKDFQ
jgi:toxin ParE1/3/4